MSNLEKKLYKEIKLKSQQKRNAFYPNSKTYRGISTVNPNSKSPILYDFDLIKQDIINHFHIKQGEKLSDPTFGTIIWDILFEPLTERVKDLVVQNVTRIITADPRVKVDKVIVDAYESGIQIDVTLMYVPYNITESMRLQFDQNAGFLSE